MPTTGPLSSSGSNPASAVDPIPRRYFWSLVRWCMPYIRPYRGLLTRALSAMLVALVCQAVIPLVISDILMPPTGGLRELVLLAALIGIQLLFGYVGQRLAMELANRSTTDLRLDVFSAVLSVPFLQQPRLFRSSVVSRHTGDVDHIGAAIERTITAGLPSVVQVAVSLVLLTYVDYRSGIAMLVVTVGFLIARARIGRKLLIRDRQRLDANSQVGDLVDESISMTVPLAGLRLEQWHRDRFDVLARRLERATQRQNTSVTQLNSVATAAGLIGLLIIMLFASAIGGSEIALVAAALLYITNIVEGLARLPAWVRDLQLAVVSRRRIDQILMGAPDSDVVREALAVPAWCTLAEQGTTGVGVIGLVTAPGVDEDHVLAALTGDDRSDAWRVSLFGKLVRREGVRPEVVHVPDEPALFNVSVRDHFLAMRPDIDDDEIVRLLTAVDLGCLLSAPDGLDTPVGQAGSRLTSMQRARLTLAMGMCARSPVLLVGPLTPLADIDSAGPLVAALRRNCQRTVVMAVRSPDIAALMDEMVYMTDDDILTGTHHELLTRSAAYSRMWTRKLLTEEVDLSELGLDEQSQAALHARLVTEHFPPGEVIYRQGDFADRVLFIISGHVEIRIQEGDKVRRIAVLGPGNHCGDLHLSANDVRAETAVAVDDCVIRSLSVGALASGLMGLAYRPLAERRVVAEILRNGPAILRDLYPRLAELSPAEVDTAVGALLRERSMRDEDGVLHVIQHRRAKRGTADLHARLLDL